MSNPEQSNLLNEQTIEENTLSSRDYKYGFVTDIETDRIPNGLSEDVVRMISEKRMSRNGCFNFASKPIVIG